MRKVVLALLSMSFMTALLFAGFAFIALDVDFRSWSEGTRVCFIVFLMPFFWVIFGWLVTSA